MKNKFTKIVKIVAYIIVIIVLANSFYIRIMKQRQSFANENNANFIMATQQAAFYIDKLSDSICPANGVNQDSTFKAMEKLQSKENQNMLGLLKTTFYMLESNYPKETSQQAQIEILKEQYEKFSMLNDGFAKWNTLNETEKNNLYITYDNINNRYIKNRK